MRIFILLFLWEIQANIKHLRVVWSERPEARASVSWSSQFGHHKFSVKGQHNIESYKKGKYDGSSYYYHHIKLTKLLPDTLVEFQIDGGLIYSFKSAPKRGKSFKLIFGGDSRSNRSKRIHMHHLIRKHFENNQILALVHGGDFTNKGEKWSSWKRWLEDAQIFIREDNRILPIIPTRGNHERSEKLFNQVFNWPGLGKDYFVTDIGGLSLFTLNTEISMGGMQRLWLTTEAKKRINQKWLIANYHRPAYPAVKMPSGARIFWVPLFERFKFDLVFESDGHALKSTVPIFKGKRNDEKGIVYLGEGGLGVRQRFPVQRKKWYFQDPGYAEKGHHIFILTAEDEALTYTVRLDDDSEFKSGRRKARMERRNLKL